MITLNKAFAERTMELLIKNNMSKYRLEKETGFNHSTLINIFKGGQKDVKLSTVAKVARVFKMTMGEFMTADIFESQELDFD